MTTPVTAPSSHDDFFIGWLPMPGAYARFLRPIAIACLVLAVGVAGLVAARQRDPGPAQWKTDQEQAFTGLVFARPYAMLYVPGPNPGDEPRTMLLVESGKFGALPRVRALH